MTHQSENLVIAHLEVVVIKTCLELIDGHDTVGIKIESAEHLCDVGGGLGKCSAKTLKHSHEIELEVRSILVEVHASVLIHFCHEELMLVQLDDVAGSQIVFGYGFFLQLVHVHTLFEEASTHDSGVSLRWLVNHHGVVVQKVQEQEFPVFVFLGGVHEFTHETKHFPIILKQFQEIFLRDLRDQIQH